MENMIREDHMLKMVILEQTESSSVKQIVLVSRILNKINIILQTKSNRRYMASLALGASFSLSVSLASVIILELVN